MAGTNGTAIDSRSQRVVLDEKHGQWLIGSVLRKPELMDEAGDLDADDLSQFDIGRIWRVMQRLHADGIAPDLIAVPESLEAEGILEEIGGVPFVSFLAESAPDIVHIDYWLKVIRRSSLRRKVAFAIADLSQLQHDPRTTTEELMERIAEIGSLGSQTQSAPYRVMTAAELDAADLRFEFLVEGVLVKGQPGILGGVKKSLKTNAGAALTLSLASGDKWLNHFYVPRPVRVAFMTGESGDATIQETLRRQAWSMQWKSLSDYENAIFSWDLPQLGQPRTKRDLIRFINDYRLDVLIIDPAYLCMDIGDSAGNLFKVGPQLRVLTEVLHETGCTPLLQHHCKENPNNEFTPPKLESLAWAGFKEWARQWILLGRREEYDEANPGSHRLWMRAGGSAGHSGLWGIDIEEGALSDQSGRRWEVSVSGATKVIANAAADRETQRQQRADEKAKKQLEADCTKLLAEYQKKPAGDTEKYFRDRVHLNGIRGGLANEKLLADGLIVECTVAKNNREYPGFKASGLTGSDRVTTGSDSPVPVGASSGTTPPVRGLSQSRSDGCGETLIEAFSNSRPDDLPDFDSIPFGGQA